MSSRAAADLAARDLAVVWHPCTQMHDHETLPMLPIARADGAWLTATDGRRYLDAVSSWWTCLLGHRHPRIVAALRDQLDRLDHVMLAGFTHEPAIELAEELVRIAPRQHSLSLLPASETHSFFPLPASGAHAFSLLPASGEKVPGADEGPAPQAPDAVAADPRGARGPSSGAARHLLPVPRGEGKEYESVPRGEGKAVLTRVFYADNGSSAVEVALKLSFHYWKNLGRGERTRFIALTGSYHGETLGALSVSDVALYRRTYAPLLLEPILAPSPDAWEAEPGESARDCALRRLGELRAILERHAQEVCAIIVEPLVQCAGGMRMHDPVYITGLRRLCDEFGVHLIADEIAVGFGRTGSLFACEQAGIAPDFLCLSKGLTGGTMALSAVLTTDEVYAAFYAEYSAGKAFLHSHSFTGNPLACRAALATLGVLRDEPVLERNRELAAHLAARIAPLADHPNVADVRQTGMIAAIELVRDKVTRAPFPAHERRGLAVYRHGLDHGVVLRPLGNVVYFMPPYCITPEEIERMVEVATGGIERATS